MGHVNDLTQEDILLSLEFIRSTCGMESLVHMHGPL